jgi:hypothetical protein
LFDHRIIHQTTSLSIQISENCPLNIAPVGFRFRRAENDSLGRQRPRTPPP